MTTSFLEKMAESAKVALDTFGLAYDAVVPSDDMLIVMNPKEKSASKKTFDNSHGGFAGKSLIEKIRDDLDETFAEFKKKELLGCADCGQLYEETFAEGMCQALSVLRGTTCDEEWAMTEFRYEQKSKKTGS